MERAEYTKEAHAVSSVAPGYPIYGTLPQA